MAGHKINVMVKKKGASTTAVAYCKCGDDTPITTEPLAREWARGHAVKHGLKYEVAGDTGKGA